MLEAQSPPNALMDTHPRTRAPEEPTDRRRHESSEEKGSHQSLKLLVVLTVQRRNALSPETLALGCRSFKDFESQLGGFPFEIADLLVAMLSLVELGSAVYELHSVAQHAVDKSG